MTSPKRLAIDVDGVVADFATAYAELLIFVSGEDKMPVGWRGNLDLFNPVWDWETLFGYEPAHISEAWEDHIKRKNSVFWRTLEPLAGARDALRRLNSLESAGEIEVFFVTNRMGHRAKYQTEQFLYDHGINFPSVVIASYKAPVIAALNIEVFIDDKLENFDDMDPEATRLYVCDAPYNRENAQAYLTRVTDLKGMMQAEGLWRD